jgi:hypothetical protein
MSGEYTGPLAAQDGFYITFKSHGGRVIAYPQRFASQELAQGKLDRMGKEVTPQTDFNETMHVIEVKGEGKVSRND